MGVVAGIVIPLTQKNADDSEMLDFNILSLSGSKCRTVSPSQADAVNHHESLV